MTHTNKRGDSKLLKACTLPITGVQCVKKIVTDLAVLDVDPDGKGFVLRELAPGVTVDEVKAKTEGNLIVAGEVQEMRLD
jgi:3-oxoacid CoA-transferase subunit B